MDENTPIKVSELTESLKYILESRFFNVYVVGEISNYKKHQSGHHYFALKDELAQISCVVWRSNNLSIKLQDGMKVVVRGALTVYPPQGKYQLEVSEIFPEGRGELYIAFEKLKAELEGLGYFDQERKRRIKAINFKIGISTSPTGAAIQDMITTIQRRFPNSEIYFRPTNVQGDSAAQDIVNAIQELNKLPLDVIIIGRGGGSIEDLWSYNTRIVADAILGSRIPIVSAVGHETDFTISDFVADLRAATPTAAAEIVTSTTSYDLENYLVSSKNQLNQIINQRLKSTVQRINDLYEFSFYKRILDKLHYLNQKLDDQQTHIERNVSNRLESISAKTKFLEFSLNNLHPLSPLNRGFAMLRQNGKLLDASREPNINKELEVIRKNDKITTKILSIENKLI
jgi:exodeoxyribonuclease VII large subunit